MKYNDPTAEAIDKGARMTPRERLAQELQVAPETILEWSLAPGGATPLQVVVGLPLAETDRLYARLMGPPTDATEMVSVAGVPQGHELVRVEVGLVFRRTEAAFRLHAALAGRAENS